MKTLPEIINKLISDCEHLDVLIERKKQDCETHFEQTEKWLLKMRELRNLTSKKHTTKLKLDNVLNGRPILGSTGHIRVTANRINTSR